MISFDIKAGYLYVFLRAEICDFFFVRLLGTIFTLFGSPVLMGNISSLAHQDTSQLCALPASEI